MRETFGAINPILSQFSSWFDEEYMIGSNHDGRLAKATNGELDIGMLLGASNIQYSPYEFLFLETSKRGLIRVSHPQNFSATPVALGQQLYDVSPVKAHQVLAHTHIQQSGWTKDGLFEVHSLGTCRDAQRSQYKAISVNKFHEWTNGFLVVQNGYFQQLSFKGTDWKALLGKEPYALSPFAEEAASKSYPHLDSALRCKTEPHPHLGSSS